MSHFAQIDEKNVVTQVIRITQDLIDTGNFGNPSSYIQTSFNTRGGVHYDPVTGKPSADQSKALRKNYAGIGDKYDRTRDAFIRPQPFASWSLNEDTCLWDAPEPMPQDGKHYYWDETTLSWKEFDLPVP